MSKFIIPPGHPKNDLLILLEKFPDKNSKRYKDYIVSIKPIISRHILLDLANIVTSLL